MAQSQIRRSYTYLKKWSAEPSIEEEVNLTGKPRTFNIGAKKDVKGEGISYFPIYEATGGEDETGKHAEYIGVYEFPTQTNEVLEAEGIIDEDGDPTIVYDSGEAAGTFKDPSFATAFTEFPKSPKVSKKAAKERETAAAEAAREERAEEWKRQKEAEEAEKVAKAAAEKAAAAEAAREERAEEWKRQKEAEEAEKVAKAAAEKAAAEKAAVTEAARQKKAEEWKRQKEAEEAEKVAKAAAEKAAAAEVSTKRAPLGSNRDWIARYFDDGHYKIVNVPGDGSCFFFTLSRAMRSKLTSVQQRSGVVPQSILDALRKVGGSEAEISAVAASLPNPEIDYTDQARSEFNTVAAMRIILSKLVTENMLQNVLQRFEAILGGYPPRVYQESTESTKLAKQIESVMQQINKLDETPSSKKKIDMHLRLMEKLEQLLEKQVSIDDSAPASYDNDRVNAAIDLGVAEELLPFDNDNITTLQEYRDYILSNEFWANDWAIGQLEYLFNIKTIIFENSRWTNAMSFNNPADDNVLLCGPVEVQPQITGSGSFTPTDYILINWTGGVHFELITYDNMSIFIWEQLPNDVKRLILYHCKEHNSGGSFEFIPDVINANVNNFEHRVRPSSTAGPSTATGPSADPPELEQLTNMGFERKAALKALAKTKDVESAIALLLGDQSIGGKKTRRRKSYKHKTKKRRHKGKKNLQKKERKTRGHKVKSRSTKKKN